MKKNYFMLAAAVTLFAACAETDMVEEVNDVNVPQAIGFDAFTNKAVRAEINNVADLQNVGFQVWGYKAATATPMDWTSQDTIFDNVNVSYDGAWKYVDIKYWDRTSTYKFYAVAPATPTDVTYSIVPETGMITIDGAKSAISTASNDYLIDRDGNLNVNGAYAGTSHDAVNFDFHHIMSKVVFKLKAAVPEEIKVTGLTMKGWNNGVGKFVQTLTTTPNVATNDDEWSIATAAEGNITLVGGSATQATITLNEDMSTVSDITDQYIMVPQTIDADKLTFTIDFEIDGEKFVAQVGKLATEQVWGTDAVITYTISVGPDVIDFDVAKVCNWDNGSKREDEIE